MARMGATAHIRLSDLRVLLGMSSSALAKLLAGVRPLRMRGERRYRWRDVLPLLQGRAKPSQVQQVSSKYWVAGYPELLAQWHPTRNGGLRPDEISYGSSRRIWWRCPKGRDHEWRAIPQSRTSQGTGCPFCSGARVSVTNSLATRAPKVAAEWHPARNGSLTPRDVVSGSTRRVWWTCRRGPDHEWRAAVNSRAQAGAGCPFCASRALSITNAVASLPAAAAQWHPRNRLGPERMTCSSMTLVWWRCNVGHEWRASPHERVRRGRGCPYCAGKRVSLDRSLAAVAPDVAQQWHPTLNGPITPFDVSPGSSRKFFWQCPRVPTHVWSATANNRARKGSGCPQCADRRRKKEGDRRLNRRPPRRTRLV